MIAAVGSVPWWVGLLVAVALFAVALGVGAWAAWQEHQADRLLDGPTLVLAGDDDREHERTVEWLRSLRGGVQ